MSAVLEGLPKHYCHWPGCRIEVKPSLWGCKEHWFRIPLDLRSRIWRSYRPGQELDKRPSPEYIGAAADVQKWILDHGGVITTPQVPHGL